VSQKNTCKAEKQRLVKLTYDIQLRAQTRHVLNQTLPLLQQIQTALFFPTACQLLYTFSATKFCCFIKNFSNIDWTISFSSKQNWQLPFAFRTFVVQRTKYRKWSETKN
jgi:hypothetical protein